MNQERQQGRENTNNRNLPEEARHGQNRSAQKNRDQEESDADHGQSNQRKGNDSSSKESRDPDQKRKLIDCKSRPI